jgi:hypothetical protein
MDLPSTKEQPAQPKIEIPSRPSPAVPREIPAKVTEPLLSTVSFAPDSPSKQTFIVTRNGELMDVTESQLAPEERQAIFPPPEKLQDQVSPLSLDQLKKINPNYDYGQGFTQAEIDRATAWAKANQIDPRELSPAQIFLANQQKVV